MKLRTSVALVCALWSVPAAGLACNPTSEASYGDVTQIYVRSEGLTAPVLLQDAATLRSGDCPETRSLLVWHQGASMGGGPLCYKSPSGKLVECCGATTLEASDPPAEIFVRLLGILQRDRFYELAKEQPSISAQSGVIFDIAVLRCVPPPRVISVAFTGPPTPNAYTTVLRVAVPLGASLSRAVDPGVARLLEDVTDAVYRSHWEVTDVY